MPGAMTSPRQHAPEARPGATLRLLISIGVMAVFVVMWLFVAAAAFGNGAVLEDAWEWMTVSPPLETIVVWVILLPVGVWLWAWQADLSPLLMGVVLFGLVVWTLLGLSGFRRASHLRASPRS